MAKKCYYPIMEKMIFNGLNKIAFSLNPAAKQGESYTIKPVYKIKAGIRNEKIIEVNINVEISGQSPFELALSGVFGFERGERDLSAVTSDCVKQAFSLLKKKVFEIMMIAGIKPYELPEPDFSKTLAPKNNLS